MTVGSKVSLRDVSKTFETTRGDPYVALSSVDLEIPDGDFLCLLGPSGCGKTTLLNLIAGFEQPSTGEISMDGRPIVSPGADRAVVFQDAGAALFPWLTVRENIGFGPNVQGKRPEEYGAMVEQYAELVGLLDHLEKFPFELSGGMKQRVQIARALVNEPGMLLMDEPFAALDAITKRGLQRELARVWAATRKTVVYITHDITEALLLGQRIGVMSVGPAALIKALIPIDLVSPRDTTSPEFVALERRLENLIGEEINGVQDAGNS